MKQNLLQFLGLFLLLAINSISMAQPGPNTRPTTTPLPPNNDRDVPNPFPVVSLRSLDFIEKKNLSDDPLKLKLCVFGDAGTGFTMQYTVAKALVAEKCSQIRFVGDIIYDKGLINADDKILPTKFLNPYQELLEKEKVPFYMATGNHDFMQNPDSWYDIADRYPEKIIFPNYYYAEKWGPLCFATFETDILDRPVRGQVQSEWFESIKKNLKSCQATIAFAHHPYLSVGLHANAIGELKTFLEKNIIGQFDLYISGHDHNMSDEGSVKETRLLVSGAGSQIRPIRPFAPKVFGLSRTGYVTLQFSQDAQQKISIKYQFKTVDGMARTKVVHQGEVLGQGLRQ